MIDYTYKTETVKIPVAITCDVCKKLFIYEDDSMAIQEFHHIRFTGGYDSIFGDGSTMKADIWQDCLMKLLGEYLTEEIPDSEDQQELKQ